MLFNFSQVRKIFVIRTYALRCCLVRKSGFRTESGTWKRGIVFGVEQGADIGNVAVTVQYPHIRGKVQRADRTPIADERIKFRLRTIGLQSESSRSSSFNTDVDGYFRYYVDSGIEEPTFYVLSVAYAGQTVSMNPIVLKSGDPTHDLIFTFDSPSATP